MTPEKYLEIRAQLTKEITVIETNRNLLDADFAAEYGVSENGILTIAGLVKLVHALRGR